MHAGFRRADFEDLDLDGMPKRLRKPVEEAWKRHANPGRVLGTVELVDCQTSALPWAIDGDWHWLLADPKPYTRPVAAKGQLGLWEWKR